MEKNISLEQIAASPNGWANNPFIPAFGLSSGHLQTIWPNAPIRWKSIQQEWERLELPDGDFVDLVWATGATGIPVILLHGLGGSINSPYAHRTMAALKEKGFRPVLMHYRGTSGEPNRLDASYHSGHTDDVAYLAKVLQERFPGMPLYAVGFSVGANILLRWLGQTGDQNPLSKAIAISCPFELSTCATLLSTGFAKTYQWWLLKGVKHHFRQKFKGRACPFDYKKVMGAKSFWEFDDWVTAPLYGFKNVHDYYAQASSRQYLKNIAKKTLIIHAKDDPFTDATSIPNESELSQATDLLLTEHGGHVGFYGPWGTFWLDSIIPEYLK